MLHKHTFGTHFKRWKQASKQEYASFQGQQKAFLVREKEKRERRNFCQLIIQKNHFNCGNDHLAIEAAAAAALEARCGNAALAAGAD